MNTSPPSAPAQPTAPARPIVLYAHPLSGHCHRVQLFLHLLGLPYELREIDLRAGEQRQPAFLALNPHGQVPVIDDGGTVVADSNAILVYLAGRYAPGSGWLPDDPLQAAEVQRWFSVAAGPLDGGPSEARVIHVFGLDRDPAAAVARAHRLFGLMDTALAARPHLAGPRPTLADLALYAYTAHAPEGGVGLDRYPAVRAWLGRIEALPGFVPMLRSPWPELVS